MSHLGASNAASVAAFDPLRNAAGEQKLHYDPIDYQDIIYYSAPKSAGDRPKSLADVDPELLRTYEKLGIPMKEREALAGVAVDAVFDSVSVATTFKAKLAEQAIRTWVGESLVYRTLGMIEAGIGAIDSKDMDARLRVIEEYAAECSIIKVALSEYCDFVTDEMVQIFGGYGYSADYPAERAYRDTRINRIFEGTNEINRMLIPGRLMKSALSGNLALLPAAQALMDEVLSPQLGSFDDDDIWLLSQFAANTPEVVDAMVRLLGVETDRGEEPSLR